LWAGLVSFCLAMGLTGLVMFYPRAIATAPHQVNHGLLALFMWGIAAGFVHGVGLVPRTRPLRLLLGPIAGWPLMLGGLILLLQH
jgi:predicted membrane protein